MIKKKGFRKKLVNFGLNGKKLIRCFLLGKIYRLIDSRNFPVQATEKQVRQMAKWNNIKNYVVIKIGVNAFTIAVEDK